MMKPPTLIIAGTTSSVGKTTISLALMYALKYKKGFSVQPFKIGPDFIDPSYHKIITGRESRTLDAWMMGNNGIISTLQNAAIDVDVAIIEGVMGLFDGLSGKNDFASTAYVAKILSSPVILVIDAAKAARSIAAMAFGYLHFDRRLKISGIILNNVSGPKHARYITEACKSKIKVPILGIVQRDNELRMDERHLGLIPTDELDYMKKSKIMKVAKKVSEEIYYDKIVSLFKLKKSKFTDIVKKSESSISKLKVGVALDNSFNFYYNENLNSLRNLGAEITFFSPLNDNHIPNDVSGLMLGGGFPEVMADKLHSNQSMRRSIKTAVEQGMPIYGECGGLMYLTKSIAGYRDFKRPFKMVGVIDANTIMTGRLTLNYTQADMTSNLFGNIQNIRGHEFHYSKIENIPQDSKYVYKLKRGSGIDGGKHDGVLIYNSIASYMHLHFHDSRFPNKWIKFCINFERR